MSAQVSDMPRTGAIAVAQTMAVRGAVDVNLAQHVRLARLAADEGAQVLVFPELSLTGYELDLGAALAFSEDDARLAPLIEQASSSAMILIAGAPVRIGPYLHIGAFIIHPDGAIDIYAKQHLGAFAAADNPDGPVPPAEQTVFRPGDRNPLVRFGGYTAAVAVCADTGQPSHAEAAASRGAGAYLVGAFVIPDDLERDAERLRTYAERHAMIVAFANYGGPTGGLASGGQSAIWSEKGDLLAQLDAAGAGIVVATRGRAGWHATTVMLDGV